MTTHWILNNVILPILLILIKKIMTPVWVDCVLLSWLFGPMAHNYEFNNMVECRYENKICSRTKQIAD